MTFISFFLEKKPNDENIFLKVLITCKPNKTICICGFYFFFIGCWKLIFFIFNILFRLVNMNHKLVKGMWKINSLQFFYSPSEFGYELVVQSRTLVYIPKDNFST